jgi:hypothetical protein
MSLTLDDLQLLIDYAHSEFANTPHGVSPIVVLDAALSRLRRVKEEELAEPLCRWCGCQLHKSDYGYYCSDCK